MDKLIQQLLEALPLALPSEWGDLLPPDSSCHHEAMANVEACLIHIIDARLVELGLIPPSAADTTNTTKIGMETPYERPR